MIILSLQSKFCFLDAMTAIAMAWESNRQKKDAQRDAAKKKKQKYLPQAQIALQTLQTLARHAPENLEQKVFLVEAEVKALEGDIEAAVVLFKQSMEHAEKFGAISDNALACERTGLALRNLGQEDNALDFLEDCCGIYRQWGALVKVNHVKGNVIPQAIYEWEG